MLTTYRGYNLWWVSTGVLIRDARTNEAIDDTCQTQTEAKALIDSWLTTP